MFCNLAANFYARMAHSTIERAEERKRQHARGTSRWDAVSVQARASHPRWVGLGSGLAAPPTGQQPEHSSGCAQKPPSIFYNRWSKFQSGSPNLSVDGGACFRGRRVPCRGQGNNSARSGRPKCAPTSAARRSGAEPALEMTVFEGSGRGAMAAGGGAATARRGAVGAGPEQPQR